MTRFDGDAEAFYGGVMSNLAWIIFCAIICSINTVIVLGHKKWPAFA